MALAGLTVTVGGPIWPWPACAALTGCCALLAADRVRSLGHRVGDGWLVARSGSLETASPHPALSGIIGHYRMDGAPGAFQRRTGVATLAGTKRYQLIDVPAELAWSVAATASPWVAESRWAHSRYVGRKVSESRPGV
jgi:putative membrane protein